MVVVVLVVGYIIIYQLITNQYYEYNLIADNKNMQRNKGI